MKSKEGVRARLAAGAADNVRGKTWNDGSSQIRALFAALFSLCVLLSVTDLWSTAVSLRMGLSEGNYLLIAMANHLGLSIIGALGLTKVLFVLGSLWATLYGVRTRDPGMRRRALFTLSFLVVLLLLVSLNNIYWISSG